MAEKVQHSAKTAEVKRENSTSKTRAMDYSQSMSSPVDQVMYLQRMAGNQAVQRLMKSGALRANLRIGALGDVHEQEADRVADAVMRMPEPTAVSSGTHSIQRACPKCENEELKRQPMEEKDEDEKLQRKPVGEEEELQVKATSGSIPEVNPDIESHIQSLKGGGKPLSENERAFFEPRFGQDFSQVRVHTDVNAANTAQMANAQAFTIGNDVVFGQGQYVHGTSHGKHLMAHELTHVVQQKNKRIETNQIKRDHIKHIVNTSIPFKQMLYIQRRTIRESYATAAFETGPVWDVSLVITNVPDRDSEYIQDFNDAAMDGIRSAVYSFGRSSHIRNRVVRVRIRYRRGLEYSTISQEAFAIAIRSVQGEVPPQTTESVPEAPVQRPSQEPQVERPARPVPKTIIVIGSPSRDQAYRFQFVTAALCNPGDENTLWLVERSGYEIAGGSSALEFIENQAPPGGHGWITTGESLVGWLNSMPDGGIGRLIVYSHGVPGQVTLRYGWSSVGMPDYGLSIQEVARMNRNKFTPDAQIEFNSCNTGSQTESGNLAQEIANQTGRPVEAWTGRTSYAGINRGTCSIGPSTVTGVREFFSEQVYSRWIHGRVPRLGTFQPATPPSE